MKTHIEKNTVQETLVIPLYGRKLCTEQFPNLFQDNKAVERITLPLRSSISAAGLIRPPKTATTDGAVSTISICRT